MPGIADLVPAQVQANSLGAVAQPIVDPSSLGTLPEFKDFMDAYRQGVITVEDIKRRQTVGTTGYEAERAQNVAAKGQAEQAALDLEVRPIQRELAKAQAQGGVEQQTILNQMNSEDPAIAIPAQEAFVKRARQKEAILVFGTATPELKVKQEDVKPAPFEEWVLGEVNNFRPGDNSEEANRARAVYKTNLEIAGEKGPEYGLYKKEVKERTRTLEPGTPEYDKELRHQLSERLTHEKLQEIQFETMKELGKAQAQAVAKGPEQRSADVEKIAKEYNALPALHDFDKVDAAYNKLITATDPAVKPTPLRDQAAIFQWMKILDPGSTVREGEYASVKNARGVPDTIMNWYNQTLTGQILTPEQRKELREAAVPVYQGQVQNLTPRIKQYVERERSAGLPPGSVVPLEHRALLESGGPEIPGAAPAPSQAPRPTVEQANAAPVYSSLAEIPATVQFFKKPNDPKNVWVNPNFQP